MALVVNRMCGQNQWEEGSGAVPRLPAWVAGQERAQVINKIFVEFLVRLLMDPEVKQHQGEGDEKEEAWERKKTALAPALQSFRQKPELHSYSLLTDPLLPRAR